MFFVFQTSSRTVHEYKDLASLLEGYESLHSEEDLFWSLGLKSWVPIQEVLTDNLLKRRKFQIPPVVDTEITQTAVATPTAPKTTTAPQPQQPKTKPPTPAQNEDFKIITYEPPKAVQDEPKAATGFGNKRKFPRFDIRLKVIISNKEKTFLSYTSNASMGGVALEDNIPKEFFNPSGDTEIFISSPKKNEFLAFRCQPVGDDEDPKRFSFGEISQESLIKFQEWIDKLKG